MEPHFSVEDNTGVNIIIFSKHIVSIKEGSNEGSLIDLVNGVSIFIPQQKDIIMKLVKESFDTALK